MSASPAAEPSHSCAEAAVPGPPQTGDPAVDAALVELGVAARSPVADQVEAYVGAHRVLQDRLADIDG